MKKIIYFICTIYMLLLSCSTDGDLRTGYSKNVDIKFVISSSDESKLSSIETSISNGVNHDGESDIDITTSSYSNTHLPFEKLYINQTVKYNTSLFVSFKDNSGVPIEDTFESYTIVIDIFVDGENMISKEFLINEAGFVGFASYDLI